MGPLALMAKGAGLEVFGSDLSEGAVTNELYKAGIPYQTGPQDGRFLQEIYDTRGVDWFVHTSALPPDAPELKLAEKLKIRISKRDELIAYLIEKLGLKLVAIAGTHGKTTTTAMIIWACQELGLPVSYLVGSTLPFAEAGVFDPSSEFLVYEADEYDRNFLHFSPWLAVVTSVSYDHPDIYPSPQDYEKAFLKFMGQSEQVLRGKELELKPALKAPGHQIQKESKSPFTLAGAARRADAELALEAVLKMAEEVHLRVSRADLIKILNRFPGVGRRFERIADGVYSDYGHHPEEIAATVSMALEEAKNLKYKGVVAVYEPHQNVRQHQVYKDYRTAFEGVEKLFWLPTYLVREDPELEVLNPGFFISRLANFRKAEPAELNAEFAKQLKGYRDQGYLILLMTAGPADGWLRQQNWK